MERAVLYMGSSGQDVDALKRVLKALKYRISESTGDFDIRTRSAIEMFQNDNGLIINGVVDKPTWNALEKLYTESDICSNDSLATAGVNGIKIERLEEPKVKEVETGSANCNETKEGSETWGTIESALSCHSSENRPVLKDGSRSVYVTELKAKLKKLGYYQGEIDDDFGNPLENAVIKFQWTHGLTDDGIVGPETWKAIYSTSCINDTFSAEEKAVLRMGDSGEYVTLLQTDLKELDFYHGDADGKYGSGTDTAVRNFQSSEWLNADGVVGKDTWNAIDDAIKSQPSVCPVLLEGASGPYVTILQAKLRLLGCFSGSITGSFGPETTEAIKTFQKDNGLRSTGTVCTKTWNILHKQTANPPTPVTMLEEPRPSLRYGDSGEYVVILQKNLYNLMYYNGSIDGEFDWETQVAVKMFQDASRLTPDGIVGDSTWRALYSIYVTDESLE